MFQYLVSRYGANNFVFSAIHLDWIPRDFSLLGQPVTVLISSSTSGGARGMKRSRLGTRSEG